MKPSLILFTSAFPFGKGETFLENEIDFLSENFDEITIVSANENDALTRKVPHNVKLLRESFSLNTTEKFLATFCFFFPDVFTDFFKNGNFKINNFNFLCQAYFKSFRTSKYIKNIITNQNYSIENTLLYTYWWMDESSGVAKFKSNNPQVKAITRAHRFDLYKSQTRKNYIPLRSYSANNLEFVASISDDGKKYIENEYGINNVIVSKLGTKSYLQNIREYNESEFFLLVTCSRISPNKNVKKIAQALKTTQIKNLRWVHFGNFDKGVTEAYYAEVLLVVDELEKKHNIIVELKGDVPNVELMNFYMNNQVDVFLNASNSEGIPVSIMEAMSFGVPCIATNVGGTSEIVNSENGLLLSSVTSPDEISEALNKFYNLPLESKIGMRNSAFETWKTKYNATTNYSLFTQILMGLFRK